MGIKIENGAFTEFTPYINYVLSYATRHGKANKGWLAKSLFFDNIKSHDDSKVRGFSTGRHYESLYWIGKTLKKLYENNNYETMESLNSESLNKIIMSKDIYKGNKYTQRLNFEKIIEDIFKHE